MALTKVHREITHETYRKMNDYKIWNRLIG